MCGISGIISPYPALVKQEKVKTMVHTLRHRGPDGEGMFTNEANTVCLGHNRLAIIDTSDAGIQPLHFLHYTIVFNGEIYNYLELKQTLQKAGYQFQTHTDTEVIPAAFDYWGKDCLHQFDGMFAFALYNNKTEEIFIARDRFGEKPLYYHAQYQERGRFEQFVFASEMKALWAIGIDKQLNGTMMLNYITLGYTQNPIKPTQTFYSNILSLPAGHYLVIHPSIGKVNMKRWYKMESIISSSTIQNPLLHFNELLDSSINKRLRSDVSIGASFSGGIDSASIVAHLVKQSLPSINTFSAIFPGFEKDESAYINAVLESNPKQNIQSHFITPTVEDWSSNWQKLQYHQEEPMQSASVFTQFMVYQLAKQNGVKVLLDGQGADEILGGYKKYTPWFLQENLLKSYSIFLKEKKQLGQNQFLDQWGFKNWIAAYYPEKTAKFLQQKAITLQANHPYLDKDFYKKYANNDTLQKPVVKSLEDILYYNTFKQGLQELLRYADRNSMAHSVEVRLPFLNNQLVEFLFSLPSSFKMKDGFTKWILRKSVSDLLPESIVWRKGKIGYEPPQKEWMNNAFMIDKMNESREKLVDNHLLNPNILKTSLKPKAAHEDQNFDWRYLSAAAIL